MMEESISYEIDCTPCEHHQKIPGTDVYRCVREFNYKKDFFKDCPDYIKKTRKEGNE